MFKPKRITLEVCNMCQLKCPLCDTPKRKKKPGVLGWGYLPFEKFKKLIDDNPSIEEVELSWKGEIFLNPDLSKIMKYAFEKGVVLSARGGVNFNYAKPEVLRDIVKYRFGRMFVALDGASQSTYSVYRQGGDIRNVISNVVAINRYKKEYGSDLPELTWQFIVFGHNEHEIEKARGLAEKLDMKFATKSSWDPNYSPVRNWRAVKKTAGKDFISRNVYAALHGKDYNDKVCRQLWDEPVISWNGDVFGCCQNAHKSLGNVFESGLEAVLNSDDYKYMQDMVTGKRGPQENIVCTTCSVYKNRKRAG